MRVGANLVFALSGTKWGEHKVRPYAGTKRKQGEHKVRPYNDMLKRLILALCLALAAMPAWATWAQTNNKTASGTTDPISTAAFTNALHNPSIIIVTIGITGNTNTSTPYDTAGNTYIDSGTGQIKYASNARTIQVFYALNTSTTASNVVSLANPAAFGIQIIAEEWTGGATSSPVDGTPASNPNANTGTGGGQNMTVGPTTPTLCTDLIIGAAGDTTGTPTFTIGPGFTAQTVAGSRTTVEYVVQTTPAAISATWNDSVNSDAYGAIVAAFKAASQSCSATLSETNIASDAIARVRGIPRTESEGYVASDSIARSVAFGRGDSESNATSDSLGRAASLGRADSESNTASDAISRLANYGRSDTESWIVHRVILNWDPSSSTGTVPGWDIGYNVYEGPSADSITTLLNDSPVAEDCADRATCTYQDLICDTPYETCYYDVEAVWIQDESQASAPSDIVSGTIPDGASDVLASNQGLGRSASESNTTSDAISRLAGFGRSDSEINTASDRIARLAVYGRDESESQTASDAITRSQGITRQANEANTASDTLARLAGFGRSETESNTTSATVGRLASFMRNDAEALIVTDSLGRIRGLWRGETELLSTSDSLGRVLAARRGDTETLAFADSIVGLRNYRLVVLPRHASAVPGQGKTGAVPGQAKTGVEAGRVKSGTAPVH